MDAAFMGSLPTDGMRLMLHHWNAARGGETVPRRPPFDPLHLPDQLRFTQLHERKSGGRYLCRVSGTAVVEAFGFESTGRYVDETVNPVDLASRVAIMDDALHQGAPIFYSGRLAIPQCEWKGMKRLIMPFSDAAGDRRFVLSILHFLKAAPLHADRHGISMKRMAVPAFAPDRPEPQMA